MRKKLSILTLVLFFSITMIYAEDIESPDFIPSVNIETPVVIDTISVSKLGLIGNVESVYEVSFIVRSEADSVIFVRPARFNHNSSEENEGKFEIDDDFRNTNFCAIFNPNALISKYVLLWPNLESKEINEYKYVSGNKLTKHSQFMYFSDATISNISSFSYRGNTNLPILIERVHNGYPMDKIVIEYNLRNQPTKISVIDSDGETQSKIYHYNDCGLIFHNDTEYESSVSYVYDSDCIIIEERNTWGDNLYFTTNYSYENGLISKIVSYRNSEPSYTKEFSYANGKLTSITYSQPNANKAYTETFEYDGPFVTRIKKGTDGNTKTVYKNGNVVLLENDKGTFSYNYQFDDRGNWIQIVEIKNGNPTYGRKRIIKYF